MRIFWFVGLPLTFLAGVNTFYLEKKHYDHIAEVGYEERPAYDHMRIRTKVS